jgi:hypothetical protein
MTAFDSIHETYDLEELRDIVEHGCVSGVAHDHVYYQDTNDFYDTYQSEIVTYLEDNVGIEVLTDIFKDSQANLTTYKNNVVWAYIEFVAGVLIDQHEFTTNEYLSDSEDDSLGLEGLTISDLQDTEWGRDHLEVITA